MSLTRISTFGVQNAAIAQLMAKYASIARTQNQLATGQKLLTAADDPVAAGVAVALDRAAAENERYGANANLLGHRLNLAESSLADVTDRLNRLREIVVQANSGIQNEESRQALLVEVRGIQAALFAIANRSDGQGRFLFGGAQDDATPFVSGAAGVSYSGDQTVREIDVTDGLALKDVEAGSEAFMRVGAGRVLARVDPANTGTAVLKDAGFTDPSAWVSDTYTVSFSEPTPGVIQYDVLDGALAPLVPPVTGVYQPDQAISFNGFQLTLEGTPAAGDSFTVAPRVARSVFEIAADTLNVLALADAPPSAEAAQQNGYYALLEDLQAANDHVTSVRASIGTRLALVDRSEEERGAQLLTLQSTLSGLRDLDYAEAISRLSQEVATLEAAQESYKRMQSLSLFDRL